MKILLLRFLFSPPATWLISHSSRAFSIFMRLVYLTLDDERKKAFLAEMWKAARQ